MDAEFKLVLGGKKTAGAVALLENIYKGNNLQETYKLTRFYPEVPVASFIFGYTGPDNRILAGMLANELKIYLENTVNPNDFIQLKERVNGCYHLIDKEFKKNGISIIAARAIVTISSFQIPGEMKTWWGEISADFKEKKDKLFIEPVAALLISFLTLKFGFVNIEDHDKDLVKTLIGVAEVYLGIIIVYFGKFLFKRPEKKFTFKLEL